MAWTRRRRRRRVRASPTILRRLPGVCERRLVGGVREFGAEFRLRVRGEAFRVREGGRGGFVLALVLAEDGVLGLNLALEGRGCVASDEVEVEGAVRRGAVGDEGGIEGVAEARLGTCRSGVGFVEEAAEARVLGRELGGALHRATRGERGVRANGVVRVRVRIRVGVEVDAHVHALLARQGGHARGTRGVGGRGVRPRRRGRRGGHLRGLAREERHPARTLGA